MPHVIKCVFEYIFAIGLIVPLIASGSLEVSESKKKNGFHSL